MKFFNKIGKYCYRPYRQFPLFRMFLNNDFLGWKPRKIINKVMELDFYITWLWFTFMFSGWYREVSK